MNKPKQNQKNTKTKGWRFTSTKNNMVPSTFWGLSRAQLTLVEPKSDQNK